jgi:hypothetical protein
MVPANWNRKATPSLRRDSSRAATLPHVSVAFFVTFMIVQVYDGGKPGFFPDLDFL